MAHTIGTKLGGASSTAAKSFRALGKVRGIFLNILKLLVIWQDRAQQRRALSELNERMRKDIGVSHADAVRESLKPFWLP